MEGICRTCGKLGKLVEPLKPIFGGGQTYADWYCLPCICEACYHVELTKRIERLKHLTPQERAQLDFS